MGTYSKTRELLEMEGTSHAKILRSIKPNSAVLEFGSADGAMTEYMRNILSCDVYIVEINNDEFNMAMKFAKDGLCCDASKLEWLAQFSHISFDYIVFSDVLEHLYDPSVVLKNAITLLKEDGRVLISVPNIAHNAVILNLISNKFEYKKWGLLDNTHIRFFTYYSLLEMLDLVGLTATTEDATYMLPCATEFNIDYDNIPGNTDILKSKHFENVYQFVFEAVKKEFYYANKGDIEVSRKIMLNTTPTCEKEEKFTTFYFDTGNGFNEDEKLIVPFVQDGTNRFNQYASVPANTKLVRFDPIESKGCILKNISITSNEGKLLYTNEMGNSTDDLEVFCNTDPQILISVENKGIHFVKITGEILEFDLDGMGFVASISDVIAHQKKLHATTNELKTIISDNSQDLQGKQQYIDSLVNEVKELHSVVSNNTVDIDGKQQYIDSLVNEVKELHSVVSNNAVDIDGKQQYINSLVNEVKELHSVADSCANDVEKKQKHIDKLENVVQNTQQKLNATFAHASGLEQTIRDVQCELDTKSSVVENLEQTISDKQQGLEAVLAHVDELEEAVWEKQQGLNAFSVHVDELEKTIYSKQQWIDGLLVQVNELENAVWEKQNEVTGLRRSTSWIVTAPLRGVSRGIRWTAKMVFTLIYFFLRTICKILPIPRRAKISIRNGVFRVFGFMFRHRPSYKIWLIEQTPQHVSHNHGNSGQIEANPSADYTDILNQIALNFEACDDFVSYKDWNIEFSNEDVKPIAFYLPQFHTIPENDEWWGKGFTEWTNVTKAMPHFVGHYQPHLPIDLGFYDLAHVDVMKRQVELAKNYGIFGFCFHYYWFGGKRLLEKPIENYLATKEDLDFPFCLSWANENWTRRWDGLESDVLMAQKHSDEDDLACIQDLCRYFSDSRYIRVNGKPLIIIYAPTVLPNAKKTISIWRKHCKESGIGDIHVIGAQTFGINDPTDMGFDGGVEFPPHRIETSLINDKQTMYRADAANNIYDIEECITNKWYHKNANNNTYRTIFPNWDNTARKGNKSHVFQSNPRLYKEWLLEIIHSTRDTFEAGNRFLFINAWNEWAEGAHLEPDRKYGYAFLEATAEALYDNNAPALVSVVAPAYNHEKFIESSLKSVANQSYSRVELIIIDDSSSDKTVEIIERLLADEDFMNSFVRVEFIKHEQNKGASYSINEGLRKTTGEYIAIINTDDYYDKNRLSRLQTSLLGRELGFAFSAFTTIDDNGEYYIFEPLNSIKDALDEIAQAKTIRDGLYMIHSYIPFMNLAISTGNMFFTRKLYEKLGGFSEFTYIHDWDFVLRAALATPLVYVPTTTYLYSVHETNAFKDEEKDKQQKKQQVVAALSKICTMVLAGEYENEFIDRQVFEKKLIEVEAYAEAEHAH